MKHELEKWFSWFKIQKGVFKIDKSLSFLKLC